MTQSNILQYKETKIDLLEIFATPPLASLPSDASVVSSSTESLSLSTQQPLNSKKFNLNISSTVKIVSANYSAKFCLAYTPFKYQGQTSPQRTTKSD
jgi:hypothetical protein